MKHAICFALLASIVLPLSSEAQEKAGTVDQAAIELAAAARFRENLRDSRKDAFANFAFDRTLYTVNWPTFGDPIERGVGLIEKEPPARRDTTAHAASLVAALGVAAMLPDSGSCLGQHFTDCRKGSHAGVMAFSPALIRGDSARIRMHIFFRSSTSERMVIQMAEYLLVREIGRWRVYAVGYLSVG